LWGSVEAAVADTEGLMARAAVMVMCLVGWVVLAAAAIAPLVGMALASTQGGAISTAPVAVPAWPVLLLRSVSLSVVATLGAMLLGVLPAAVLGAARRRWLPALIGLAMMPLLVPPQVYAYAWQLTASPGSPLNWLLPSNISEMWLGGAVRAGLISAGWLWPGPAMILAAGWRSGGRAAYTLALLDTSPTRAYLRAVLPSLRPHLAAAAGVVFAITLIEYPIPHLTRCRVYATELLVLVDVAAPHGQVMRMAAQVLAAMAVVGALVVLSIRSTAGWEEVRGDSEAASTPGVRGWTAPGLAGWPTWAGSSAIWLGTVGIPVGIMWALRPGGAAWRESFVLFEGEWAGSLAVSAAAGALAVTLAAGTALLGSAIRGRWLRWVTPAAFVAAIMPPAALGIGFVVIFNRSGLVGELYRETPCVWTLALVARYGAVAVLIAWLAVGRRGVAAVDQARTDGAGPVSVVTFILLPMIWQSLLAAALIVTMLSLFEVVITQLVGPVGYPSIAMSLLGQMHYGRDNVVITTSGAIVGAGFVLTQVCGWLLVRREK
jgi:iron(III) transport system permease protein